ncbi:hypothetical protein QZM35_22815 [Burkholderia sp. AU45274]|uniref:hypothetical protein n=1 Tax=Burkholderia sp. AU45274 TaxID=3059205 RepID=UPI002655FD86|nr:hypothetical protein [Burkholderia sp. AU45274]MDN7490547.1 hypothetical protein [Burkholderia sp. AU45274]
MTTEEMLQRLVETEPATGKWAPIERYAQALAELERMLSDREMEVFVQAGARLVRAAYPEVFRIVRI